VQTIYRFMVNTKCVLRHGGLGQRPFGDTTTTILKCKGESVGPFWWEELLEGALQFPLPDLSCIRRFSGENQMLYDFSGGRASKAKGKWNENLGVLRLTRHAGTKEEGIEVELSPTYRRNSTINDRKSQKWAA